MALFPSRCLLTSGCVALRAHSRHPGSQKFLSKAFYCAPAEPFKALCVGNWVKDSIHSTIIHKTDDTSATSGNHVRTCPRVDTNDALTHKEPLQRLAVPKYISFCLTFFKWFINAYYNIIFYNLDFCQSCFSFMKFHSWKLIFNSKAIVWKWRKLKKKEHF